MSVNAPATPNVPRVALAPTFSLCSFVCILSVSGVIACLVIFVMRKQGAVLGIGRIVRVVCIWRTRCGGWAVVVLVYRGCGWGWNEKGWNGVRDQVFFLIIRFNFISWMMIAFFALEFIFDASCVKVICFFFWFMKDFTFLLLKPKKKKEIGRWQTRINT
jgi:hypothetical protein